MYNNELNYYKHLSIPSGELRISIVSGCDMRCWYCHNEGQGEFGKQKLTLQQIDDIIQLGLRFGISKVRLTGGEPLIHRDIFEMLDIIKNKYNIRNVGINTNGTKLDDVVIEKLKKIGIDNIVVGLDYFDAKISKDSKIGKSSSQIKENILKAKKAGLNVQIASVLSNSDIGNTINIIQWGFENDILVKVLEVSDDTIINKTDDSFIKAIEKIKDTFKLQMGKTVATNETYGVFSNGAKVLFFHSHCKVRECYECSLMHMRVTSDGFAKPCILRKDTEYNIINEDKYQNMLKAIHNLGNPPENIAK